ncbi:hypothetical protein D9T14_11715 [Propionibacterium australiense]|nr:hypothetical protein D9T14_11715 [Propionibacterium australiense]
MMEVFMGDRHGSNVDMEIVERSGRTVAKTWPGHDQVRWRVVLAAAAAMTVEGYDLNIYGSVLPFLTADENLGMTTGAAGLVGSAVFCGMLVGGLCVGRLSARLSQVRVLRWGIVVFSAAMFGASFVAHAMWL